MTRKCFQNGNFSLCPLQVSPELFGKGRNQTLLGVVESHPHSLFMVWWHQIWDCAGFLRAGIHPGFKSWCFLHLVLLLCNSVLGFSFFFSFLWRFLIKIIWFYDSFLSLTFLVKLEPKEYGSKNTEVSDF